MTANITFMVGLAQKTDLLDADPMPWPETQPVKVTFMVMLMSYLNETEFSLSADTDGSIFYRASHFVLVEPKTGKVTYVPIPGGGIELIPGGLITFKRHELNIPYASLFSEEEKAKLNS